MTRVLTAALAAFLLASCGGGIDSYEDAMNAQADLMKQMINVLEDVNDEASAEKAVGKIQAIGEQMAEIAKKVQDLPRPSAEEMRRLSMKQQEEARAYQGNAEQMMKLAQYPALGEAWTNAMMKAR